MCRYARARGPQVAQRPWKQGAVVRGGLPPLAPDGAREGIGANANQRNAEHLRGGGEQGMNSSKAFRALLGRVCGDTASVGYLIPPGGTRLWIPPRLSIVRFGFLFCLVVRYFMID